VHLYDRLSTVLISVGGLGVVVAVLGICVYLVGVTSRLLQSGEIGPKADIRISVAGGEPLAASCDEYRTSLLALDRSGMVRQFQVAGGTIAAEQRVFAEATPPSAIVRDEASGTIALGFPDGRIQLGRLGFETDFLSDSQSEAELATLDVGATRAHAGGVVSRTPLRQLRRVRPVVEMAEPVEIDAGKGAVKLLSYAVRNDREMIVALRDDGTMVLENVKKVRPLGGGPARVELETTIVPYRPREGNRDLPAWMFVTADGANILTLWADGTLQRYSTADLEKPAYVETIRLAETGRRITQAAMLLGGKTLITGDDAGAVSGSFAARDRATTNVDRYRWVRAHDLGNIAGDASPVVAIGISSRDRCFTAFDAKGRGVVWNMTSAKRVVEPQAPSLADGRIAIITPKMDGVMLVGASGSVASWAMMPGHPEATLVSAFGKVWYEGEESPAHVYQSSSGDDSSEPKLGLTPLVFGTLKATIYTLIIAVPLAILAAIFTSEFLDRRTRAVLKPVIETMASLPSVVMGFIAAIVVAPLVLRYLPGVLLAFVTLPIAVVLAAHLWNFLPRQLVSRGGLIARVVALVIVTAIAGWATLRLGPVLEGILFSPRGNDLLMMAGGSTPVADAERPEWFGARRDATAEELRQLRRDGLSFRDGRLIKPAGSLDSPEIKAQIARYGLDSPSLQQWLNGVFGGAWPGWLLLTFPAAIILGAWANGRYISPWLQGVGSLGSVRLAPGVELAKFVGVLGVGFAAAAIASSLLTLLGLDPRDSIFGTLQQRNTLVVALAMSVAVIPLVYTLCEDAMSSVPEHLRSASLAAGATRWQTALRIVLPVAASGVFSATMIGLGRAAGETMIILMATGNTPIMSWSIFDGMRTLSANIAVELPEAPVGSTHYRVLFLCGLVLFVLTFAVNTLAEMVRIHYRKRSAEL
jgi:phosphate transport system permease protein